MVVRPRVHIDMTEYKKSCIEIQQGLCPVTMHECEPSDGEILYLNGLDYFISRTGLKLLRDRFGDRFIDERLIDNFYDADESYYVPED
jgi:hypothetical protein